MLNLYWKKTILLWLLAPFTAVAIYMTYYLKDSWYGIWSAASIDAFASSLVLGPLIGGVVAVESHRKLNVVGIQNEKMSPDRGLLALIGHLFTQLVFALAPFVFSLIYVFVVNLIAETEGHFRSGYLTYNFLFLTTLVLTSYLVGSLCKSPMIAGTSGVAVSLILTFYSSVSVSDGSPQYNINPVFLLIYAALLLMAIAGLLSIFLNRLSRKCKERTSEVTATLLIFAVLAGYIVPGLLQMPSPQLIKPPEQNPVCSSSEPQVCLWPEHSFFLADVERMALSADEAVSGIFEVPSAFYEYGVYGYDPVNSIRIQVGGPGLWFTAGTIESNILSAYSTSKACFPEGEDDAIRQAELYSMLSQWLQIRIFGGKQPPEIQGDKPNHPEVNLILLESPLKQREWLTEMVAELDAIPCSNEGN